MIEREIQKIQTETIKDIFYNYISKRIPFKFINSGFVSLNFENVAQLQNMELKVEKDSEKVQVSLMEFLEKKCFYLNTQYNSKDGSLKEIIQDPLLELLDFFSLRPEIIGNLVPRQYTMWLGFYDSRKKHVSSGLHYDFHDNLYIVLEGVKKFRIYSPKEMDKMYLKGEKQVYKRFESGFVSYSCYFSRGDGAEREQVLKYKLMELENEDGVNEEEIEKVLQELLEISQDQEDFVEDSWENSCSEASVEASEHSQTSSLMEQENKKIKLQDSKDIRDIKDIKEELNFSRIKDTSDMHVIERDFPKFKNAQYYDVTLRKGDGLFLPAGWFHEVWSFGDGEADGVHMAMNYWMAPCTRDDFDHPYEDGFWEFKWNEFLQELKEFKNSDVER